MLIEKTLDPIEIRPSSLEAVYFKEKSFNPILRRTKKSIDNSAVSVFLWAPDLSKAYAPHVDEFRKFLYSLNIRVIPPNGAASIQNESLSGILKDAVNDFDLFFAIIPENKQKIRELQALPDLISKKLLVFTKEDLAKGEKKAYNFELNAHFCKTEFCKFPEDLKNQDFINNLSDFLVAIKTAKYLQSAISNDTSQPSNGNGRLLSIYDEFFKEIEIFNNENTYLFLLSFLCDLRSTTLGHLRQHFHETPQDIQTGLINLKNRGYLRNDLRDPEKIIITDNGYYFFELFDIFELYNRPLLPDDKRLFRIRWKTAIENTCRMTTCLFDHDDYLKEKTNDLYFAMATSNKRLRKFKHSIKKWLPFAHLFTTNRKRKQTQVDFLQDPLVRELFDIWRENVSGVYQVWKTDIREETNFIEYIYDRMEIARHPKFKDVFINYSETAFGLGMLRPNSQVHIYLTYAFFQRPIKELISDYLDMAIIAGRYDLLLKRYKPYHSLLKLHTKHGERTPFDSRRGIDFKPLTYRLDTKFTVPIELNEIQTRQIDRYISCPALTDPSSEAEKSAEIGSLEAKLKEDVPMEKPNYGYFSNVELRNDGQFYNRSTGEVIPVYGMKRAGFIQTDDYLKLVKAIPRPSPKSGLIIRFNLLDPVFVLTEGIHKSRDIDFDDIKLVLKILDVCQKRTRGLINKAVETFKEHREKLKTRKEDPNFNQIYAKKINEVVSGAIDEIFNQPDFDDLSPDTLEFLHNLDRFKEESHGLSSSWKYLTSKLVEGKSNNLLIAICQRLMDEGFDLTFSILPLMMPTDIAKRKIDEIQEARAAEDVSQGDRPKGAFQKEGDQKGAESVAPVENKTLLPLIELLKREIQDLLKKVFSHHLDISAATKRARSEPAIARMIIHHCLNVKSDRFEFRKSLEKKLREHYAIHHNFLNEYYAMNEGILPAFNNFKKVELYSVLKDIHGLGDRIEDKIKEDIEGISTLIDQTRLRLYSPSENNRLLCFIDPDSVEVQIGDFEYSGAPLENEEEFLEKREAFQVGLAEEIHRQYFEAQKKKAETSAAGVKKHIEMKAFEVMEEHQVKQALMKANISVAEIEQAMQEVKLRAYEALKNGELKEYAISALVEAHSDGGIDQVTDILRKSPKAYLAALDRGLFEIQETAGFKEKLLDIAGEDRNKIDPITMAMLFNNDFKDVVGSYIHQQINDILTGFFKNIRKYKQY